MTGAERVESMKVWFAVTRIVHRTEDEGIEEDLRSPSRPEVELPLPRRVMVMLGIPS